MHRTILVDHRERADILIHTLEIEYGFEIVSKTLKYGDYFIEPDIILERKTVRDFVVSILDGRLFNQAYRLSEFTERPIIVIEGSSFEHMDIDFSIDSIKGALITLAQTFHIPVLRTRDEYDTAWHINHLHLQRERVGKNKGSLYSYAPKRLRTQKIRLLRTLPGIGPKTAASLLEHFESITNIINASEKELMEMPSIGKITAKKIKNLISENKKEYKT